MATRKEPDHYARKARREGYPARSVYKLKEIQERFRPISSGARVLDIGAAPGSWSKYALSLVGPRGSVVAVDLSPIRVEDERVTVLRGDIFDEGLLAQIKNSGPYDCILSDAAPNTTGNRTVDTARSAALVEHVITLCDDLISENGNLVVKIFQGGEEQRLLGLARERFRGVRALKPASSRSKSFEVFIIGTSYTSGT